MRPYLPAVLVASAILSASPLRAQGAREITPQQVQFFENQVRPIFANHCFRCHGPEKQKGHLRVDTLEGLLKGGESGAVLVPGKPEQSLFIKAINYQDLEMPPGKKLARKDGRAPPVLGLPAYQASASPT
jgi:hypothetical protein